MVIDELTFILCVFLKKILESKFIPQAIKVVMAKFTFKVVTYAIRRTLNKLDYLNHNKMF